MAEVKLKGGEKLKALLEEIAKKVDHVPTLRVGFLGNATYPDGKPVAMIASIQEFGAPRAGIPPRPFFRNMIADKEGEWPQAIATLIKDNKFDIDKAFDIAGQAIAGQLRQSIIDTNEPPLAPSTVKRKGFDKPLIDTGVMINAVDYEVVKK